METTSTYSSETLTYAKEPHSSEPVELSPGVFAIEIRTPDVACYAHYADGEIVTFSTHQQAFDAILFLRNFESSDFKTYSSDTIRKANKSDSIYVREIDGLPFCLIEMSSHSSISIAYYNTGEPAIFKTYSEALTGAYDLLAIAESCRE